eukprot:325446-Rhodomonas_salina.1
MPYSALVFPSNLATSSSNPRRSTTLVPMIAPYPFCVIIGCSAHPFCDRIAYLRLGLERDESMTMAVMIFAEGLGQEQEVGRGRGEGEHEIKFVKDDNGRDVGVSGSY